MVVITVFTLVFFVYKTIQEVWCQFQRWFFKTMPINKDFQWRKFIVTTVDTILSKPIIYLFQEHFLCEKHKCALSEKPKRNKNITVLKYSVKTLGQSEHVNCEHVGSYKMNIILRMIIGGYLKSCVSIKREVLYCYLLIFIFLLNVFIIVNVCVYGTILSTCLVFVFTL